MTRRGVLLGVALALSAIAVGSAFTPVPHTGGDNSGYLSLAHDLAANGTYTDVYDPAGLPHTKYPPVFPLVLAALMAVGARSWVAFKLVSAVAAVAAVGLTYLWAERRLGDLPAAGIGILFAFSSVLVYYSHWILSDPLFVVLTLASLVALDRAVPVEWHPEARTESDRVGGAGDDDGGPMWVVAAVVTAGLALFTRSAGLPLIVAVFGWLLLARRWRSVAAAAVAIGVPSGWWWWRARGAAVASYGEEFWMVDPIQPALGTVDLAGLGARVVDNLGFYVLLHGPSGIVGQAFPALTALGVTLTVAAIIGWVLSIRDQAGPAELFFPLYAGLILLWPTVWSGDRFALPLYPFVFVYGAVALRAIGSSLPALVMMPITVAAYLVLLLPAGRDWVEQARQGSICADVARTGGAFACYAPAVRSFADAAEWSARALPEDAVVLTRKPRHFYIMSGLRSRTFAFSEDPAAHLALADSLGARYVLLDEWDGVTARYVASAVQGQPGAFCVVRGFGQPLAGGAQLLGIRPPQARSGDPPSSDPDAFLVRCPADYLRPPGPDGYPPPPVRSLRIPLLERSGS